MPSVLVKFFMVQCKMQNVGLWVWLQPSQQHTDLCRCVLTLNNCCHKHNWCCAGCRAIKSSIIPRGSRLLSNVNTFQIIIEHNRFDKVKLCIEPAHQRGPMQLQHVTVSSSPCDQRQRCPVVLWNPPRERRGDRIQLLFGPECDQGAALSVLAAKWTNNWPPHALWLWNLQGPTHPMSVFSVQNNSPVQQGEKKNPKK